MHLIKLINLQTCQQQQQDPLSYLFLFFPIVEITSQAMCRKTRMAIKIRQYFSCTRHFCPDASVIHSFNADSANQTANVTLHGHLAGKKKRCHVWCVNDQKSSTLALELVDIVVRIPLAASSLEAMAWMMFPELLYLNLLNKKKKNNRRRNMSTIGIIAQRERQYVQRSPFNQHE